MHKREIFNKTAYFTGISSVLRKYKKLFVSELPILAYHRILDIDPLLFKNDIELVSSNLCNFEKQIAYICKHYQPITFYDLDTDGYYRCKSAKPPIIITFDDGFIDNYEFAFPLLKKYDAKATFFIVSNVIDRIEPLWFDLLAYQIMSCVEKYLTINKKKIHIPNNHASRRKIIAELLLELRPIKNEERIEILNSITDQLHAEKEYLNNNNYLSWKNIKEMSESGMEFGSHSMSHPILASMSDTDVLEEVKYSKSRIENELNKKCISFSYPVGGYEEYTSYAVQALEQCDYKFSCTYEPGLNKLPLIDCYQLKRIHIERYTTMHTFKNVITSSIFGYK